MSYRTEDERKLLEAFIEWLPDNAHIFLDEAERGRIIEAFMRTRAIE